MSHRMRWSAAGFVVVSGLAVGVARQLHLFAGSESTAVPTAQAEHRYEDLTSSATTATGTDSTIMTGQLPAPGVYVYDTTGSDSVDALNGAHHDYPATTTITVTPSACGVQQRWDVLEQRWEAWQRCIDGAGVGEPGRTNYDEFFGRSQTDTCVCTGTQRPLDGAAGTPGRRAARAAMRPTSVMVS